MRLMKLLAIVILGLASSTAMAKDKYDNVNCSKLDNDDAQGLRRAQVRRQQGCRL